MEFIGLPKTRFAGQNGRLPQQSKLREWHFRSVSPQILSSEQYIYDGGQKLNFPSVEKKLTKKNDDNLTEEKNELNNGWILL